ncbi:glycosyltransferase [Agromyces atrinae]|nr:glycosyl transferase [Agromyces atrinae]NYD68408.1 glycosyltransferase involved in cell wall biosynthesis [Agromyces atrinae]
MSVTAPIVVLESLREIRPTTNPYLVQLIAALESEPGAEVRFFSYRRALFGHYDVFHVHWPEIIFGGHRLAGRVVRRLFAAAFLLRLRMTRTPVIRTWHNLERPDGLGRIDALLLDGFDRATTLRIRLNDLTEFPSGELAATIPHGHYRDWFERFPTSESVAGRVAYVGLIRRYKGVEGLVEAFRSLDDPSLSLHVSGKPSTPELAATLRGLAAGDDRIALHLAFLDEPDLVRSIGEAELVVLPYRHMHNSGTVLAALSLDRPVLVPANDVNRRLAIEVGAGWVHLFDGDLGADDIAAALAAPRPETGSPDLGAREWTLAGAAHADAFRTALDARAGHRRRRDLNVAH